MGPLVVEVVSGAAPAGPASATAPRAAIPTTAVQNVNTVRREIRIMVDPLREFNSSV
jgi:hypothetical protein